MSKNVYLNETRGSVIIETSGIPDAVTTTQSDVGMAAHDLLMLLGAEDISSESDTLGTRMAVAITVDAIRANLARPDYTQRAAQIAARVSHAKQTGAIVPSRSFAYDASMYSLLLTRIPDELQELPYSASLARMVGAIVVPFAETAHTDGITPHYNQIAFWRLGDHQPIGAKQ